VVRKRAKIAVSNAAPKLRSFTQYQS
jgi:hypothetical protein